MSPANNPPSSERRSSGGRSDPLVSLAHLLESARRLSSAEALALADESGLMIAGAGAFRVCEALSALAPFLAHSDLPANDIVPNRLDVMTPAVVRRLRVDGVEVLLCARGGGSEQELALNRAADGVRRILERQTGCRRQAAFAKNETV